MNPYTPYNPYPPSQSQAQPRGHRSTAITITIYWHPKTFSNAPKQLNAVSARAAGYAEAASMR